PIAELTRILAPSTFARRKAVQIQSIARRVAEEFAGNLPCDRELILSFAGVGIKCANLTLGIACGEERMSVDVHVHRIVNRWGYVSTPSPEATTKALELEMPSQYWVRTNALLVPFGKHICTGQMPRCSTCPVLEMCAQHGVTRHR
ncbi:MAG: endonuclease III, partial [Chloroflexia bacterium]|nr:endonuclease III [Chloroflexia bacterium]